MRRFVLFRSEDVSGVSGTGIVAEGVEFTDGRVSIRWFGDHPSTVDWDTLADAMAIHGHNGSTTVRWLDNEQVQSNGFRHPALAHIADMDRRRQAELTEQGRRLASEREDLIAGGADPSDLTVPLHPILEPNPPASTDPRQFSRPSAVPAHATIREDPHSHKPMWYWADEDGEHAYPTTAREWS